MIYFLITQLTKKETPRGRGTSRGGCFVGRGNPDGSGEVFIADPAHAGEVAHARLGKRSHSHGNSKLTIRFKLFSFPLLSIQNRLNPFLPKTLEGIGINPALFGVLVASVNPIQVLASCRPPIVFMHNSIVTMNNKRNRRSVRKPYRHRSHAHHKAMRPVIVRRVLPITVDLW